MKLTYPQERARKAARRIVLDPAKPDGVRLHALRLLEPLVKRDDMPGTSCGSYPR